MKNFEDKVAVITGGASGIGFATAKYCVNEKMKIVIADIEDAALKKAQAELEAMGADVLSCKTDVSKKSDIETLAQATIDKFGGVHLLFNNAGVGAGTTIWESTTADWEWTIGVNLYGVVHGIQTFVPIMLEQDEECHIINTASIAGLIAGSGLGIYKVTKHAVVTLSETLYHELGMQGAKIGVSVLCPGFVQTRIHESGRNRPSALMNDMPKLTPDELKNLQGQIEDVRQAVENGMPVDKLVELMFDSIRENKLYILTHPEMDVFVETRMNNILQRRNPKIESGIG